MTYNPNIHHRRSIRLKDYDYSQAGAYFATLCAWQRECLFGDIVDGVMALNDAGRIVAEEWERIENVRDTVVLDEFVVMPNHFHAIIFLTDSVGATPTARPETARLATATISFADAVKTKGGRAVGVAPTGPSPGSIGAIMAQFKSRVSKRIATLANNHGCPVWQRNYYERVIRNEYELDRASEYIINNPMKWALDKENPDNCG